MPRKTRKGAVTRAAVAGGVLTLMVLFAAVSCASAFTPDRPDATPAPAAVATDAASGTPSVNPDDQGCAAAARDWTVALTDKVTPAPAWVATLSGLTAPEARQALSGFNRLDLPSGPVQVSSAVSQPGACDATVTVGGVPLSVQAVPSGAGWVVSGWGSQ